MAATLIVLMIGLPWLGALAVWIAGDGRPRAQHALAAVFSVAGGLAALLLIPFQTGQVVFRLPVGPYFGDLTFSPDGLGVLLASIAAVIGSLAVIFSIDYMRGEEQLGRYYALVLVFIGAMAGLVLTESFLFLFVFWEITALCSYALISFHNDDPKAVRGGIKALIITQVGGVGLLAGALTAYAYSGSFEIQGFLAQARSLPAAALSLMAFGFLLAAAAKSAQFPFQTWLPDAMEAPTPVSALIHAATMVNAGVYLLARFYPAFEKVPYWREAVVAVGLISALMAACMALVASDLKRVLAYSTISQLGYMVLAIGAGSVYAGAFHLLNHAVFKALLFLAAGSVIHATGTRDLGRMGGLGKKMPVVRAVFVTGGLALAGVPILNGFWSKELILEAALEISPALFALGALAASITALYTLRVVYLVFYGEPRSNLPAHEAGKAMQAALLPLAGGALTTWLLASGLQRMLGACGESACTLGGMIATLAGEPSTYLALAAVALGFAAWQQRRRLAWLSRALAGAGRAASGGFGFEWVNRQVVSGATRLAASLQKLQTGKLNWNLVGVIGGLLAVLAYLAASLAWGA
ncbi:MAG TPA: NADH-quinone oxidoreductase subunit L [Anaerolineales bacterium]